MTYFYPDLCSAIYGQMDQTGHLTQGQFAQLYEFKNPKYGLPWPSVKVHQVDQKYYYDVSTSLKISDQPLLRDPYEQQTCYIGNSGIHPEAGEGLFVKRFVNKGTLIAVFNGIRRREVIGIADIKSDYKICLNRGMDLDIPDSFASAKKYCATIAHKACHSFTPNAGFFVLEHPRRVKSYHISILIRLNEI